MNPDRHEPRDFRMSPKKGLPVDERYEASRASGVRLILMLLVALVATFVFVKWG